MGTTPTSLKCKCVCCGDVCVCLCVCVHAMCVCCGDVCVCLSMCVCCGDVCVCLRVCVHAMCVCMQCVCSSDRVHPPFPPCVLPPNRWRFGMTLWEIASLGDTPFSDVSNRLLTDLLKRGERPPNPPGTTENL